MEGGSRLIRRSSRTLKVVLSLGYAFLYLPLLVIVFFSFNEAKLVTAWKGFSFKWYQELFANRILLRAALTSFRIAALSATISMILGTLAAITLVRFPRFRGKTLFVGLVAAPLVMPDIITGLSLLLLFVSFQQLFGWPTSRGSGAVIIAHTTLSVAYVTAVVQSRLAEFDRSLEEAALDLGASPFQVFFTITLPLIAPAVVTGWLFAFALSLDDVVIASFVAGPGTTTLPMVIFSSLRLGLSPEINALTTLLLLFLSLGLVVITAVMWKTQRTSSQDKV
ncbi:MAG: ABC transporter permease subunit [Holosporales bacterium]|jgi:putrescine transport system permease protein|nr:ABC transporter permease subunit [Holosporales bacterium]